MKDEVMIVPYAEVNMKRIGELALKSHCTYVYNNTHLEHQNIGYNLC